MQERCSGNICQVNSRFGREASTSAKAAFSASLQSHQLRHERWYHVPMNGDTSFLTHLALFWGGGLWALLVWKGQRLAPWELLLHEHVGRPIGHMLLPHQNAACVEQCSHHIHKLSSFSRGLLWKWFLILFRKSGNVAYPAWRRSRAFSTCAVFDRLPTNRNCPNSPRLVALSES